MQQKLELTTVYVTHDQEEALAVSDKIIVMNEAEISQEGTPRQLYEEPENIFVSDFIGDANQVNAKIIKSDSSEAEIDIGGIKLKLPYKGNLSSKVAVGIRPQSICLNNTDKEGLSAKIIKSSYLGDHFEYTIECSLGELFVIDNQMENKMIPGSSVSVTFLKRGLCIIPD